MPKQQFVFVSNACNAFKLIQSKYHNLQIEPWVLIITSLLITWLAAVSPSLRFHFNPMLLKSCTQNTETLCWRCHSLAPAACILLQMLSVIWLYQHYGYWYVYMKFGNNSALFPSKDYIWLKQYTAPRTQCRQRDRVIQFEWSTNELIIYFINCPMNNDSMIWC